jgi:Tfp pilus assembly protein PilO
MKFLKSIPKEKLQKMILVAVIGMTILGAVINFYVLRQFEQLTLKRRAIAELVGKIEAYEANAKSEASNNAMREQMKNFVEAQQKRMVTGDPFSWAVREISLLGERHPVHIVGLSPGVKLPFPEKAQYSLFTVRLEANGTYDQLGKFVCDLENNFPTGHIQSLTVSDANSGKGDCHVAIDMALLMAPQETKAAGNPGTEPKKKT